MKKKITILFNGAHLSYSPTVLGLYDLLSEYFDVTILGEQESGFSNNLLTNKKIVYRKTLKSKNQQRLFHRWTNLVSFFDAEISKLKKMKLSAELKYDFQMVKKYFDKNEADFIIAVDFKSLFYMQLLNRSVEFLSLEIPKYDVFYENCDFNNINSVLIQTEERYKHLFKEKKFNTFYIQNAPLYKEYKDNPARQNIVYCGTAWNPFGFYHCLEFLKKHHEYKLYVKGYLSDEDKINIEKNYQELIAEQRLLFENQYLDDDEIIKYLRQFKVGFCFYNFDVNWVNTFNYYSAPSGKMFKYLAAGVPVVGQNISGLNPIKEFDCGVLIEDLKPQSIKQAIEKIESNFDYYTRNCLKAAEHYSFDKSVQPFINYLLNEHSVSK